MVGGDHRKGRKAAAAIAIAVGAWVGLALLLAACDSAGPGGRKSASPNPPAEGLLWRIEGAGADIVVAGSVHLLRPEDHPMPPAYEAAFRRSRRLVLELAPAPEAGEGSPPAQDAARLLLEAGTLPSGQRLWDMVPDELEASVRTLAGRYGLDPESLAAYRPWMAALTLAMAEYQRIGADPAFGVDHHFETRALADGMTIEGLESPADQVAQFRSLPPETERAMLATTVAEALRGDSFAADLIGAWRRGDAEALADLVFADADRFPEVYEALVWSRNRAWADALVERAADDVPTFVLVGAGHLVGPDNLVDLLRARGLTVTRLTSSDSNSSPPRN